MADIPGPRRLSKTTTAFSTISNRPLSKQRLIKTSYYPYSLEQAILNRKEWGHIYESGIGAYLVSQAFTHRFEVLYWRERVDEVDFILRKKGALLAIEVKSNAEKRTEGLDTFRHRFNPQSSFIVGDGGISAEDFLSMDLRKLF